MSIDISLDADTTKLVNNNASRTDRFSRYTYYATFSSLVFVDDGTGRDGSILHRRVLQLSNEMLSIYCKGPHML